MSDNDITDVLDNSFEGSSQVASGQLILAVESDIFGEVQTTELKPGGSKIPVTEENKKVRAGDVRRSELTMQEYIELIVNWRIVKRVEEQFQAFLSGFNELIPQELINVFDERELELLIGGMSDVDVGTCGHRVCGA